MQINKRIRAFELEAAFKLDKVSFTANYTNVDGFIETKKKGQDTSYFNLYRRPAQTINLNAGFDIYKTGAWISACKRSTNVLKRYMQLHPVEMPAYYCWNLYSSYKANKNNGFYETLKI